MPEVARRKRTQYRTGLALPLPLQFLAAWLAVYLGRVLQQVDFLTAEDIATLANAEQSSHGRANEERGQE